MLFETGIDGVDYAALISRGENFATSDQVQFRIPCTDWTANAIVVFYEARTTVDDATAFKIWCKRSVDGGRTWLEPVLVSAITTGDANKIGNPSSAYDWLTGRLYLVYLESVDATDASPQVWVKWSDDDGATWSGSSATDLGLEISAQVIVKANGTPGVDPATLPAGHNFDNGVGDEWDFVASGCHRGIQLQYQTSTPADNGRLVIPWYHRKDIGGNYWAHVLCREAGVDGEDATDWKLIGGVDQTAGNVSNENCLIERTDGTLYMHARTLSGSSPVYTTSTDGGRTWANTAAVSGVNIKNVQGSMITLTGNRLVCAGPTEATDSNNRHKFGFYMSDDGGATWTGPRLTSYRSAAYSGLIRRSATEWLAVFEGGPGGTWTAYNNGDTGWANYMGLGRYNKAWFDTNPTPYVELHFNERAAGKLAVLGGTSIKDWSGYRGNAQPVSADSALAYAEFSTGRVGLELDGTNDYIILEDNGLQGYQLLASEKCCFECILKTSASSGNIFRSNAITFELSGGKLKITANDGAGNVPTVTGSTSVNTGSAVAVGFERNGTHWRLLVNGVSDGSVADSTWGSGGSLRSTSTEVRLCADLAANNKVACTLDMMRWTRGIPTSYLAVGATKTAPDALPTYSGQPSTIGSGCLLHIPGPDVPVFFAGFYKDIPTPGTYYAGMPALAGYDLAQGLSYALAASSRATFAGYHATAGPHWRCEGNTASHNGFIIPRAEQTFNFLHKSPNQGTVSICFYKNALGSSQFLFDNSNGGSGTGNAGFTLTIKSTNVVEFLLYDQVLGETKISASTATITANTWYHLCVVCDGFSAPPIVYLTPLSSDSVNAVAMSGGSWSSFGGTPADSPHDLVIGGRSSSSSAAFQGRWVDACIWNTPLSAANVQSVFNWTKNHANR